MPVYRLVFGDGGAIAATPAGRAPRRPRAGPPRPPRCRPATCAAGSCVQAQRLGVVWAGLAAINLATGGGYFWAVWPGIALLAAWACRQRPCWRRGWVDVQLVRLGVIVVALALINLASWSGEPWFLWPAGALLVLYLLRRTWRGG